MFKLFGRLCGRSTPAPKTPHTVSRTVQVTFENIYSINLKTKIAILICTYKMFGETESFHYTVTLPDDLHKQLTEWCEDEVTRCIL